MFSLVMRHKWVSLGIYISISIFVIILLNLNQQRELYWNFMVVFIFFVTFNFGIDSLVKFEYRKANNFLHQECDPDKYAQIVDSMYEHNVFKNYEIPFLINKGLGFSTRNMHSKHLELLNSVNIDNAMASIETKTIFLNNLMSAYIENSDFDKACEYYDKAIFMINKNYMNPSRKEMHEKSLWVNMAYIFMQQNKLEEAEKIITDSHGLFTTRYYKVLYNDILAELYIKQGRIEEARSCLEHVINNGNKLYLVEKAKNLINII